MFDTRKSYRVTLKRGAREYVHTLKQPEEKHVILFERKKDESLTVRGDEISQENHSYRALAFLWELVVEKVEGYEDLGEKWREKVPVADRIQAVRVFGDVRPLVPEDVVFHYGQDALIDHPPLIPVFMSARQGKERLLLTHLFRAPEMKQFDEYARIQALSKTRRKRNRVEILFPVTTESYCRLYEDLCAEVIGYDAAPQDIPPLHKVTAVKELMAAMTEEMEEVEGN